MYELTPILRGRRDNRRKQLALEIPTWYALLGLIAPQFVKREGLLKVHGSTQKVTALWEEVTLLWFRRNNTQEFWNTHVPDFVVMRRDKARLAIECKNVNDNFKVYPNWLNNEVISRFEQYSRCTKLVVFSFFDPARNYRNIVVKKLAEKRIKTVELGEQPLSHGITEVGIATMLLRSKLSPYVRKAVEGLKPVAWHQNRLPV